MLAFGLHSGRVAMLHSKSRNVIWNVPVVENVPIGSHIHVAMSRTKSLVLVAGGGEQCWTLLDAVNGEIHSVGPLHDGTGGCICELSPVTGKRLFNETCTVIAHHAQIRCVAFSPRDDVFATADDKGILILWDALSGKATMQLSVSYHSWAFDTLCISTDGARIAAGSHSGSSGEINVWDVKTGAFIHRLGWQANESLSGGVTLSFSPVNSNIIASTSPGKNNCITMWDIDSGKRIKYVKGTEHGLLQFSPVDENILAMDVAQWPKVGVVEELMEPRAGHVYSTPRLQTVMENPACFGYDDSLTGLCFSIDGSKLAAINRRGYCNIWDLSGRFMHHIYFAEYIISLSWGPDWVHEREVALELENAISIAMSQHPRLGHESSLYGLDKELVAMIYGMVRKTA